MLFFDNEDEFISFVTSLEKKLNEEGTSSTRPKPLMRKPESIQDRKENCLCGIQGVGIVMAKKLLDKFGSIVRVGSATEKELSQIEKLGQKTIKNIKETLN